jgi:putative hemolysin
MLMLESAKSPLRVCAWADGSLAAQPAHEADVLALPGTPKGPYWAGVAVSERSVQESLRLRYRVFNLELGEGLASSALSGLDEDEFDRQMTHIVLMERASNAIVGAYRVQTATHALAHLGLYSAREYDLAPLAPLFSEALECGRACICAEHRGFKAILTLWLGVAAYLKMHQQRYLFGCCSITTCDPDDGWRAMKTLRAQSLLNTERLAAPTPAFSCGPPEREAEPDVGPPLALPKLFRAYMRLGARVISYPAIDREFGTVDFLVLMDGREVTLSRLDVLN